MVSLLQTELKIYGEKDGPLNVNFNFLLKIGNPFVETRHIG